MVRRIADNFHPEKIILFGSRARGDAHPDSDVDLLVVMPFEGSRRALSVEIRLAVSGMGIGKDIMVATPQEMDRYRNVPGTIALIAHLEGKMLYDRAA